MKQKAKHRGCKNNLCCRKALKKKCMAIWCLDIFIQESDTFIARKILRGSLIGPS